MSVQTLLSALPEGPFSQCEIAGKEYIRSVAANPNAKIKMIIQKLEKAHN